LNAVREAETLRDRLALVLAEEETFHFRRTKEQQSADLV
jgi:hypothetical protein